MTSRTSIEALLPLIRAGLYGAVEGERPPASDSNVALHPFVTVSRQAGAGGRTFARALVERLNEIDPGERPWAAWDRELVTKVVDEHLIPAPLIEKLGRGHESAVEKIVSAFLPRHDPAMADEPEVFRRVAQAVRGIARAGRAVIVGRGGVYAARDLRGGVHVRLVAPLDRRVSHMAKLLNVPASEAAAEVRRLDHERDAFHRRYGGGPTLLPEVFTVTLNTAALSTEQMVECVLPLLTLPQPPPAPSSA